MSTETERSPARGPHSGEEETIIITEKMAEEARQSTKSWCEWYSASLGSLARAMLAWKAGNQVQVDGNVILAPNRVIWANDTDLVILYREMVTN